MTHSRKNLRAALSADRDRLIRLIQRDLPDVPSEVIRDWLARHARRLGWPPVLRTGFLPWDSWSAVLLDRPLSFWRGLAWSKDERALPLEVIDPSSRRVVHDLRLAYVERRANPTSRRFEGGRIRYWSALQHLNRHGVFERPIVVVDDGIFLTVAHGFSRLAAYFVYQDLPRHPGIRASLGPEHSSLRLLQPMWVARPSTGR